LAFAGRGDDALDLLGREHGGAVEREGLRFGQLELNGDMVTSALGDAVDRAGRLVVHARVDLEAIALAGAILPCGGAQVAQRHLAFAEIELGDLAEVRRVAVTGIARKIVEDAAAGAVDRARSPRLDEAQLVEGL